MPRIISLSLLFLALTIPGSLRAQLASARVGVVHLPPPANADGSVALRNRPGDAGDGSGIGRIATGALIGAVVGAAVTFLIVHQCDIHDTSHGDGPPCGIGYVVIGPFAVAGGIALGAIIADVTQ